MARNCAKSPQKVVSPPRMWRRRWPPTPDTSRPGHSCDSLDGLGVGALDYRVQAQIGVLLQGRAVPAERRQPADGAIQASGIGGSDGAPVWIDQGGEAAVVGDGDRSSCGT